MLTNQNLDRFRGRGVRGRTEGMWRGAVGYGDVEGDVEGCVWGIERYGRKLRGI